MFEFNKNKLFSLECKEINPLKICNFYANLQDFK